MLMWNISLNIESATSKDTFHFGANIFFLGDVLLL